MNFPTRRGFGGTPPVIKNLLIINILLLVLTYVMQTMNIDLTRMLGLFYFKSEYFRPYQLITHMFMHGGIMHLALNMFMLWMFGRILENVWGGRRMFIYYMVTGLGAAALHLLVMHIEISSILRAAREFSVDPTPDAFAFFIKKHFPDYYNQIYDKLLSSWFSDPSSSFYINQAREFITELMAFRMNIPTVGASGAVYGVLLAFGVLFPNTELFIIFFPFIPIKAKYMVIGMGLLELFYGLSQPGSNIAHFAHLGGMIFGFILIKYWNTRRNNFY